MIWNIENSNERVFQKSFDKKCNKIRILKLPPIELSKDAIWAIQVMQKLAMQNLSRLVMGA